MFVLSVLAFPHMWSRGATYAVERQFDVADIQTLRMLVVEEKFSERLERRRDVD